MADLEFPIARGSATTQFLRPLAEALARKLKVQSAILDGAVVVKDAAGR